MSENEKSAPPPSGNESGTVSGERGVASVNRIRSVQSRVSTALTIMIFGGLALAGLAWYYSSALSRSGRSQADASAAVQQRAEGEMTLPSLGPLTSPNSEGDIAKRLLGPKPQPPKEKPLARGAGAGASHGSARTSGRAEKSPLERQLGGPVIVRANSAGSSRSATSSGFDPGSVLRSISTQPNSPDLPGSEDDPTLGDYLRPTATGSDRARGLTSQQMLLKKGTPIDCTLQTAIDSTLPGFTTCVTATDTWSADGTVVLLERGTTLFGETRGQVQAGKSRLFILWSEARTPEPGGVVVPLAAPGTDPLGRTGVTGQIDRHFWSRFGSAILVSVIDGAVQSAVNSQNRGGVVVNPSGSRDVMTEILRETIRVRPTLRKNQGDDIAVLIPRDVDFRGVYELFSK